MNPPFHHILVEAMREAQISVRAFAARVGVSPSFVQQVRTGVRPPPLERLDAWLEALHPPPEQRRMLWRAAMLAHCPEPVVHWITDLEDRLRRQGTPVELWYPQVLPAAWTRVAESGPKRDS